MKKIEECTNLTELFTLWESKYQDKIFVKNGIVNPDKWSIQAIRPLFLLREAYVGRKTGT